MSLCHSPRVKSCCYKAVLSTSLYCKSDSKALSLFTNKPYSYTYTPCGLFFNIAHFCQVLCCKYFHFCESKEKHPLLSVKCMWTSHCYCWITFTLYYKTFSSFDGRNRLQTFENGFLLLDKSSLGVAPAARFRLPVVVFNFSYGFAVWCKS